MPEDTSLPAALYVVATPLGNLDDMSFRARDVLGRANVLLAEDTRSARRLLGDAAVPLAERRLLSCFDANEIARAGEVATLVREGASVAMLSEAGTPLVSDPGFKIVQAVIESGGRIVPVPGPSAVLAALVAAGLPTDQFAFLGFPPRRPSARRRFLAPWRDVRATLILYESPQRTAATLADLAAVMGEERPAVVARELTKPYEEVIRGSLRELAGRYRDQRPLGEVTLVVGGAPAEAPSRWTDDDIQEEARSRLDGGESSRDIAHTLATLTGRPRREIYALVNAAEKDDGAQDDETTDETEADDDSGSSER